MTRARLLIALLAVALAGGGWYGWQVQRRGALVRRHLPATPDLGSSPAILRESLAAAESHARAWREPAQRAYTITLCTSVAVRPGFS